MENFTHRMLVSIKCLPRSTIRSTNPRRWINSGGLGTMGFGLPAGMGVKFAMPEEESGGGDGRRRYSDEYFRAFHGDANTIFQLKIINLNNRFLGMVKLGGKTLSSGTSLEFHMSSVPGILWLSLKRMGMWVSALETPDQPESGLRKSTGDERSFGLCRYQCG